jgi:primosomal protein N''
MLEANAVNGTSRQVANRQINTATVVNEAIAQANGQALDLDGAREALRKLGQSNPAADVVESYAYQVAVLAALETLTGASTTQQIGKWDFRSAQSIHDAFNSYLSRRVQGQRSRWTRR